MNSELPETPGRQIYDVDRAIELLGGDPADAKAAVEDAIVVASIYGRTLAVLHAQKAPLEQPPEHGLFDYQVRELVDLVLSGAPEADTAARMLLTHAPGTQFRRVEVTRWARAVGMLSTPPEISTQPAQTRHPVGRWASTVANERSRLVLVLEPAVERYTLGEAIDLTSSLLAPPMVGDALKTMREFYGDEVANPQMPYGEHCRQELWQIHAIQMQRLLQDRTIVAHHVVSQTPVPVDQLDDALGNYWRNHHFISREAFKTFCATLNVTVSDGLPADIQAVTRPTRPVELPPLEFEEEAQQRPASGPKPTASNTVVAAHPCESHAATPEELLAAFGQLVKKVNFDDPTKWLGYARVKKGEGMRGGRRIQPLYCPYEFMMGLATKAKSSQLHPHEARRLVKQHFRGAYQCHCPDDS